MNPVRLLAALAAVIIGLLIVLVAVDTGDDAGDEDTISIGGTGDESADDGTNEGDDTAPTDPDVDLPVTAPVVEGEAGDGGGAADVDPDDPATDDTGAPDGDGDEPIAEPTTTAVATTTTPPPTTTVAPAALSPTDTFPCSFASRQAMLNRLSDIEDLDEFTDADLYLRTVARSILEVGQVLTEDERVTDLEAAFDAFRAFPDGCPDVIDGAFDTGDRFLCRAAQISVDERIHDYLERAVGAQMDGCTYPEIDT